MKYDLFTNKSPRSNMTEQPTTQSRMYDTAQSRKLSLVLHFLQNRMTTTIEHCRVYKEDRLQAFH